MIIQLLVLTLILAYLLGVLTKYIMDLKLHHSPLSTASTSKSLNRSTPEICSPSSTDSSSGSSSSSSSGNSSSTTSSTSGNGTASGSGKNLSHVVRKVGRGRGRGRGTACGTTPSTSIPGSSAQGSGISFMGRGRARKVIVEDQGISRPQGQKRKVEVVSPVMPVTVRVKTGNMMCGDGKELDRAINYMGQKVRELGNCVYYEGLLRILREIRLEMEKINRNLTQEVRQSTRADGKRYLETKGRKVLQETLVPVVSMVDGEIYANLGMKGMMEGGEQGWAKSRLRELMLKLEGLKRMSVGDLKTW